MRFPTVQTWGRLATVVAASAGAWLTALTTLESDLASQVALTPSARFGIAAAITVATGAAVWLLAASRSTRDRRRDDDFARVMADGTALIDRCNGEIPAGLDKSTWTERLAGEWREWNDAAWAVVHRWGSAADVEAYSRVNPYGDLVQRDRIAGNVAARLDRLERIARR